MAKRTIIALPLVWLFLCFRLAYGVDEIGCVRQSALNEVGVNDERWGGDAVRVNQYRHSVGAPQKKGVAWCVSFLSWCFQQNCIDNPRSAWSPAWFEKNIVYDRRKITIKEPKINPMDVFGIYFKDKGRIAHGAFVLSWDEGENEFETIEGNSTNGANTGELSRMGGQVVKKFRLKSQVYQISRWIF